MALLTTEQASLIKGDGFYERFNSYIKAGLTRQQAYLEVERDYFAIMGVRRYEDFTSFDTVARRRTKLEMQGASASSSVRRVR